MHQVFCVSFSLTGSLTNFLLTLIVIYRSLFRQSRFAFFSQLFGLHFLDEFCMSTFLDSTVFAFSPEAAMESSTLCRVQGYVMFIIGGTQLFCIALLSVNHYICVVKSTLYDRMYSIRNIL